MAKWRYDSKSELTKNPVYVRAEDIGVSWELNETKQRSAFYSGINLGTLLAFGINSIPVFWPYIWLAIIFLAISTFGIFGYVSSALAVSFDFFYWFFAFFSFLILGSDNSTFLTAIIAFFLVRFVISLFTHNNHSL